jgi:hypothetical protein
LLKLHSFISHICFFCHFVQRNFLFWHLTYPFCRFSNNECKHSSKKINNSKHIWIVKRGEIVPLGLLTYYCTSTGFEKASSATERNIWIGFKSSQIERVPPLEECDWKNAWSEFNWAERDQESSVWFDGTSSSK